MRDFSVAADIPGCFGVKDIALLTNIPNRFSVLGKAGKSLEVHSANHLAEQVQQKIP